MLNCEKLILGKDYFMKYTLFFSFIFFSSCSLFQTSEKEEEAEYPVYVYDISKSKKNNVDILFIIDNSSSMLEKQKNLRDQFGELLRVMQERSRGLPNLHIGVTSTDLGSLPYNLPGCALPDGDNGKLMKGTCANPINNNWIIDIEPAECNIERNDNNNEKLCTNSDCTAVNCRQEAFTVDGVASEPSGLIFVEYDENNCPRCRNYSGEALDDVFACTSDVGINGCGFEQPLEAMYKALTRINADIKGFLRKDSYLAILFITDEDDCSVSNSEIFNPAGGIADTLGTLSSFRCTEFGIKCDEGWQRFIPASYKNCTYRESDDLETMLFPVSKYINYLMQIRYKEKTLSTAIAGPYDNELTVGINENYDPKLGFICGDAVPGVRIKEFVSAFNPDPDDMLWAYTSICSNDYKPMLMGLGNRLVSLMDGPCLIAPLLGCPDPAFANGVEKTTNLTDAEAELCIPQCSIVERSPGGIAFTLEQCPFEYQGGHPPAVDPNLPIGKCFHIPFDEKCINYNNNQSPSRGAIIAISRQHPPEPGTTTTATCKGFPLTEENCTNNRDDDFDGDIDSNDSDCL
jgi:hypothetical protein